MRSLRRRGKDTPPGIPIDFLLEGVVTSSYNSFLFFYVVFMSNITKAFFIINEAVSRLVYSLKALGSKTNAMHVKLSSKDGIVYMSMV